MADNNGLQELLNAVGEDHKNNMYTSIPCIVVSVISDLEGMMVNIQPTINQKLADGTTKERTVIMGVPVQFPVSDKSGMTFPLYPGVTTGIAVFSMRSLEVWKSSNGRPSTPNNRAKFDKQDAIFIPGVMPSGLSVNNPAKHNFPHSTQDTVIFHNLGTSTEVEVRLKQDGSIVINTSDQPIEINGSDITVNASENINLNSPQMTIDVDSSLWIGNIIVQGNITQTGNYNQTGNYVISGTATFNGIPFATHKHTGVTTGSGTSGGPTA